MSKIWTLGDSFTAGFGCKYFQSIGINKTHYEKIYEKYIDTNKKIWPEIVAEIKGFDLINLAKNGTSNETILDLFIKNIKDINKNDLVIIQTSGPSRFDFPFLKQKTLTGFKDYQFEDDLYGTYNSPYRFKTTYTANFSEEWDNSKSNVLQYINSQESIDDVGLKLNKFTYDTIRTFFAEFISTKKYYEKSVWQIVELVKTFRLMGYNICIINMSEWPEFLDKPEFLFEIDNKSMYQYCLDNKKTIRNATFGNIDDYHPSYEGHQDIANFIIKCIDNEVINLHKS